MTPKTISDWANRKITEQTSDNLFFDLVTAETKNKIIELLTERVVWNYSDLEVRNLILSYYKKYLINNPSVWLDIEKELLDYFQYLDFENGNVRTQDFLYYLADDWQLRKDKYDGLLNMPEYLAENLAEYDDYDKVKKLLTDEGLTGYDVANNYT